MHAEPFHMHENHCMQILNLSSPDDDSRGMCNTNSQNKFKTSMLRSIYVIIVMHIYLLKGLYQLQQIELNTLT